MQYLGVVEDINAHLETLDILILPSTLDGRPVVVLEAWHAVFQSSRHASAVFPHSWRMGKRGFSSNREIPPPSRNTSGSRPRILPC